MDAITLKLEGKQGNIPSNDSKNTLIDNYDAITSIKGMDIILDNRFLQYFITPKVIMIFYRS